MGDGNRQYARLCPCHLPLAFLYCPLLTADCLLFSIFIPPPSAATNMQTAPKKIINAWAMYDWANSAYNLVITSTVFPAYFEAFTGDGKEGTVDKVQFIGREFVNTSLYNYALAVAFLIVAIFSPLLSSIADNRGNKKVSCRRFLRWAALVAHCCFSSPAKT